MPSPQSAIIASLHRGQNQVDLIRWRGRVVVRKRRAAHHHYRYAKEQQWLATAGDLGIPVPPVVAALASDRHLDLLLVKAPSHASHRYPWQPKQWLHRLAPLHALPAAAQGWGPLRADGQARWPSLDAASAWYRQELQRLAPPAVVRLDQDLERTLSAAQRGLIHGDCHRGNRAGAWIIDWETVAIADPWEEAARAGLSGGWGLAAWGLACGADLAGPRWRGAILRAAIEAAGHPGPRQAAAQRWLTLA